MHSKSVHILHSTYYIIIISVLLLQLKVVEPAKILAVFPTPSISHQVVFRPLTLELVRRGHEVTVITTDPVFPKEKALENLTEIDVHNISYHLWQDFLSTSTGKADDLVKQVEVSLTLLTKIFEKQVQTKGIQKLIQDKEKYDLLLIELIVRPALSFSHIFKAPVIQISSFGPLLDTYETVGGPSHPILYPSALSQKLNNLTLWEKVREIFNHYRYRNLFKKHDDSSNNVLKRVFGDNMPGISELQKNIDMIFLNTYPIWEGNVPIPPGVICMGGIHQNPVKELPKDLKSYLDSAKTGVIYISFGTNTDPSLMPQEKKQIFFKVLSESPYKVLWKWNNDDVPGHAENIRYSKWFPQSDLLRHPNVKLFITQGGLQSTDETITAGVPVIGIPMLGDQWYNVEKYVQHGIGVRLDLENLTEENFRTAIAKVIGDESYRKNIIKLRSIMHDQPISALDRAVFWAEHVIRHSGARHLRSPAANMSWREYLELDLLLILLGIVSTIITVFIIVGYHALTFISRIAGSIKFKIA